MIRISPVAFAILYCIAYVAVLALEVPLFRYYPVGSEFSWGVAHDAGKEGPSMVWYGLMAGAALVACIGAAIPVLGKRLLALHTILWLVPLGATLGCIFLMRNFFI